MTLVRWDPVRDLMNLLQRMLGPLGSGEAFGTWAPVVDTFEKDDDLVLRAEVPGVDSEDIAVSVENNRLVIQGERKREKEFDEENAYRLERSVGGFLRSFVLPKTVDATKIQASYTNGVLEVRLPKADVAKPRRIAIQA